MVWKKSSDTSAQIGSNNFQLSVHPKVQKENNHSLDDDFERNYLKKSIIKDTDSECSSVEIAKNINLYSNQKMSTNCFGNESNMLNNSIKDEVIMTSDDSLIDNVDDCKHRIRNGKEYKNQLVKIKNILQGPERIIQNVPGQYFTPLQTICYGMNEFEKIAHPFNKTEILISNNLSLKKFAAYQEMSSYVLADALMYSKEFCQLSKRDKGLLFNNLYPIFTVLEKIYFSIRTFGHQDSRTLILFDNAQAHDENFGRVGEPEFSAEVSNSVYKLFAPANQIMLNSLYFNLKKLNLELPEFTYLICQILWSVDDIIGLSDHAKSLGKNVLISLNNDLHGYYCFNKNSQNYAYALSEIMKFISRVLSYNASKKEILIAGRIFELFDPINLYHEKIELDNPDLELLTK
uniref:NR LBD domain-containing protein n=1 Tax=Rhabditophanes sp. KR3021 TaxID=114890 RepID=A0AC35TG19_9BILA